MRLDRPTILVSSGFRPGILAVLRKYWEVIDIPDAVEAIAYLQHAGELPAAVVVGYAPYVERDRPPSADPPKPEASLPAHIAMERIQALDPDLPVVISTSQSSPASIVELIKRGAFDYVVEPGRTEDPLAWQRYSSEFTLTLQRAVRWRLTLLENWRLKQEASTQSLQGALTPPRSPTMMRINELANRVAPTSATVLITGESGTGKEVLARMIHDRSTRGKHPFLAINCGALSDPLLNNELFGHVKGAFTGAEDSAPGLIRQAGHGTLVLDELSTISPAFQVVLLRVLEQRTARPVGGGAEYPARCRFIAMSNQNLSHLVQEGAFRGDLYYRLNVFHIHLPPLRDRREDIPTLAHHFLAQIGREYQKDIKGFTPEAMGLIERLDWPGNVRQLRNAIERAVILADGPQIQARNIVATNEDRESATSSRTIVPTNYREQMRDFERELLRNALIASGHNLSEAARTLNMKRTTLQYRLKQLDLRSSWTPSPHGSSAEQQFSTAAIER